MVDRRPLELLSAGQVQAFAVQAGGRRREPRRAGIGPAAGIGLSFCWPVLLLFWFGWLRRFDRRLFDRRSGGAGRRWTVAAGLPGLGAVAQVHGLAVDGHAGRMSAGDARRLFGGLRRVLCGGGVLVRAYVRAGMCAFFIFTRNTRNTAGHGRFATRN